MAGFFENSQNVIISGGSFNSVSRDTHGNVNVHSFNHLVHTIHSTDIGSNNLIPNHYVNPTISKTVEGTPDAFDGHSVKIEDSNHYFSPLDARCLVYANTNDSNDSVANQCVNPPLSTISETVAADALEIKEGGKIGDTDDEEGIISDDDDDRLRPINRTYQFYDCQTVYIHSLKASGNKVKNSGNNAPRVTYHGGTAVVDPSDDHSQHYINEGVQPFSKSSQQTSEPSAGILSPSRRNNPFLNQFMVVPPTDTSLLTLEEWQASMSPRKRDKLPATLEATMKANSAISHQYPPMMPVPTTLSDSEFQQLPINPFLPIHMGLYPNILSHIQPFPGDVQSLPPKNSTANNSSDWSSQTNFHPRHHPPESLLAANPSRDPPDSNSKRLEYYLDSALQAALIIHTSGTSSSAEILSPRAHNTLKALNALVSGGTPISSPGTTANAPSIRRRVAKWLRIPLPQAPK